MPAKSYSSPNMPRTVIDNSNWRSFVKAPIVQGRGEMSTGYERRPWSDAPLYSIAPASPLKLIPREEHKERIKEAEAKNRTLKALKEHKNIYSLDQNRTNYCWIHGVTQAMHYRQGATGEPMVRLEPSSGGAVIKQGRNVGGWGGQAVAYIRQHGIAPLAVWPKNSLDYRRLDTPEVKQIKLQNRISGFYELKPGTNGWDELVTALLNGFAVAVAFNWWGHLVCAIGLVIDERGEICLLIDNSWTPQWGDNGLAVLKGSKKYPSECHAIISKTAPTDEEVDQYLAQDKWLSASYTLAS